MSIIDNLEAAFQTFSGNFLPQKGIVNCKQVKDTDLLELTFQPPLSASFDNNEHVKAMYGSLKNSDIANGLANSTELVGNASSPNGLSINIRFKQDFLDDMIMHLKVDDSVVREQQFLKATYERVESSLLAGVDPKRLLAEVSSTLNLWESKIGTDGKLTAVPDTPEKTDISRTKTQSSINSLQNFATELHNNIRSLITQQGSVPECVLDEVKLVKQVLGDSIKNARNQGGTVIQHFAKITNRPIPLGKDEQGAYRG